MPVEADEEIDTAHTTEGGSKGKAMTAALLALDKKAHEALVLEVGDLVSYTEYFIICSGSSAPHVQAIMDSVEDGMRRAGHRPIGVEGRRHLHWVLMDYGDVVVHVFDDETRDYYELEKLWLDAPRVHIDEDTADMGRAHKREVGRAGR